jgi:hypothetical protein
MHDDLPGALPLGAHHVDRAVGERPPAQAKRADADLLEGRIFEQTSRRSEWLKWPEDGEKTCRALLGVVVSGHHARHPPERSGPISERVAHLSQILGRHEVMHCGAPIRRQAIGEVVVPDVIDMTMRGEQNKPFPCAELCGGGGERVAKRLSGPCIDEE